MGLSNLAHFYMILDTFIRFSYTFIQSQTSFLTHSNTKQSLPTLINHNKTNPFRTIIKICSHSLYTQIVVKKIFTFFFIQNKKKKMLRRTSLKDDISRTRKERKTKFNDLIFRKTLSTKNKPSNYLMPPSSWIDIESTDTFLSGLENE